MILTSWSSQCWCLSIDFFSFYPLVWDLPGSWIFCWNLHIFTFCSEALDLTQTICFIWLFFDTALAGEGRWRCCLITVRCPAEHSQPFLKPFSWSPIQCSLASVPIISDYTERGQEKYWWRTEKEGKCWGVHMSTFKLKKGSFLFICWR